MRDYDPTTGRYIQADPLGLVDGASVFGYALQNPGRYVDPRGEYTMGDATQLLISDGISPDHGFSAGTPMYSKTQIFDAWLKLERENTDWMGELEPCPRKVLTCTGEPHLGFSSPAPAIALHQGGVFETRSKPTPGGHSTQCIYDGYGNLMLNPKAAGSADYRSFPGSFWGHALHDVIPYFAADSLDRVDDYYEVRPVR